MKRRIAGRWSRAGWVGAIVGGSLLALFILGCRKAPACREGQVATAVPARPHPRAGYLVYAHSHNDYEQDRPLLDALDQGFYSVEADIFFDGGRLSVAHNAWKRSKGTLQKLYLAPLQARVDALGSVHGDGLPFTLWVELKEGPREMIDALHALLEQYPMLTRFQDGEILPGKVTVVLTGNARGKADFVTRFPRRNAVRDSNDYSPDDPPADGGWRYYALHWTRYLSSSSTGKLDDAQRARLACIVENAHASGRKVRFYGSPNHPDAWKAALESGVDFINTDDLQGLRSFLEQAR
ncbi:hypothetical protein F0U59_17405 [Archangium gephyra]|nr:hypothetical protein F0U59_17405 [Archangium gephyra]